MARNSTPNFYQPKKNKNVQTKHQTLVIERLDNLGAGIAFQNKKPVFIDGALPGEKVVAQMTESKSKFARANLIKVLEKSNDRVEPFCPHYNECGGCNMQHLNHDKQIESKSQTLSQLFVKFAHESIPLESPILSPELKYRRRARVALFVDKKNRQFQFGFRKKQSKQIVNVENCPVLDERLNEMLPELRACLSQFKNPTDLGHLELIFDGQQRIVMLRHLKPLVNKDKQALLAVCEKYQSALFLMPTNDTLEQVSGQVCSYSETCFPIEFQPNHFIQVNQEVNQKMVAQALDWLDLKATDRVLDLFCGVGNFTVPMASKVESVVGVEGIDAMVEQASQNAEANQCDNAKFYQANLELPLVNQEWAKDKFNKILLDPARAGASGIVDQLSELGADQVVYVSCNPATLARDSQSILEQGFELKKLGMMDMFPHTSHLESMALFVKK
ncbi:23S rRNA (uracil(1939)-C(5))-methyltransferase RlmD [Vibrio maerlii]|uniref:23S rRNA (uracil(1939)-C(5))-methyltransferase RlmD n=1 Tax=Vibrio maerlii TaxID=2231648 RepID=UPI000E3D60C2|nr:23S rRNA (uracil(1939)-C(5))-methyltransferase RlmD [Vibrio maerlii]